MNFKWTFLAALVTPLALPLMAGEASPGIWLSAAAEDWSREALPLGNGRLGCMVFGGVAEERIQFNVDSLWTGDENPGGQYPNEHMGAFQNFGDLFVRFEGIDPDVHVEAYRRSLDLAQGVHRVTYRLGDVAYTREAWCSRPDQVIAVRFSADRPGRYSGVIRIRDGHQAAPRAHEGSIEVAGALNNGMTYAARVHAVATSGSLTEEEDQLRFTGCDGLTVYLAAGTGYVMDFARGWQGEPPDAAVAGEVKRAAARDYEALLADHLEDHAALFSRVVLDLGSSPEAQAGLPMDKRLKSYAGGTPDPELEATLFQYGRYLLMGCSRPGTLPANLQGLWNDRNNPPWHSDYHSNINLQMNYWLAEPANLAECHRPLLDFLMAMREPYRAATRAAFGEVRGFTCRTSQNVTGGMGWKWNLPASAWYARHFWEHYAFSSDPDYLGNIAYPWLKEVCTFWEDHLKELPDGTLVAPDGWSPEHGPVEDGVSHDQQIIWDLFTMTLDAARVLGGDDAFRERLAGLRGRLAGPKIGRWGQLQEWMVDRDDPNTRHRHTSHLYAVYPGQQISRARTPDLAEAARISLEARGESGDSRRSWTWPWRCAMWARLGEPERCHDMVRGLLTHNMLPNLMASHPPMQLDGSFGITAGMCEMLLQSHAGEIHLLPALPAAWPDGEVRGLRARGGHELDMQWRAGALQRAELRSSRGGLCRLHSEVPLRITLRGDKVAVRHTEPGITEFTARRGGVYRLTPAAPVPGSRETRGPTKEGA